MSKPRAKDAEDFPIGTTVRTPTGRLARVLGHRGLQGSRARKGRGHRTWLFCVYLDGCKRAREANPRKRFSVFEATANQTIAVTMTRIVQEGYVETDNSCGYPWTKYRLTDKGRAAIQAPA